MRAIELLVAVAILLVVLYFVLNAFMGTSQTLERRRERRRIERGVWTADPRSDDLTGEKMIYLTCPGHEDFRFWPTAENAHDSYDMAMVDAEAEAAEWNRIQRRQK